MKERLYAVQTVIKLDNRIINQKLILFSAKDEDIAKDFVKRQLEELNRDTVTETVAVSITPYPMEMVVQSASGGTKVFKIAERK
jgi:hypothetical protein